MGTSRMGWRMGTPSPLVEAW